MGLLSTIQPRLFTSGASAVGCCMLVLIAIVAVVLLFLVIGLIISNITKKGPKTFHEVADRKYGYRNDPHADATTEQPNRLRGNNVTDV